MARVKYKTRCVLCVCSVVCGRDCDLVGLVVGGGSVGRCICGRWDFGGGSLVQFDCATFDGGEPHSRMLVDLQSSSHRITEKIALEVSLRAFRHVTSEPIRTESTRPHRSASETGGEKRDTQYQLLST